MEEFFRVAVVVGNGVGIFEVQVVATGFDFVGVDLPGDFGFLAAFAFVSSPPFDARLQMLKPDGLRHRIRFLPFRDAVFVKPDVFGWFALLEEQEIGADGGVGFEHAVGQADDGVEVALFHQMFLEPCLDALSEQRAVWQDDGCATAGFE